MKLINPTKRCRPWLYLPTFFFILLSAPLFAQGSSQQVLTYEAFVNLVSKQHPENEIATKRLTKAKEAIERSGLLPDPQLTVGRDQVPLPNRYQQKREDSMMPINTESKESTAQWQVGLSQSFPWPGTLSADERAAKAQAASVETDVGRSELERKFAAIELYLRMVRVSKLIAVQKSNLAVAESVKTFAHEKFKQGIGSHMQFLQTHSESGVLKANVAALETDLRNLKRHAIAVINDPALTDPAALRLELEWPSSLGATNSSADLVREQLVREKEAVVARNDAAYRRSLPSFMASGMLMQEDDSGMRMYGAMIGLSVPLYSNGQRHSLTRDSSLTQGQVNSELAWHDKQKSLALVQAQDRIAQIEANVLALRDEIIPPVKEHIEAATVQFSQGQADIGAIIEGRRTLLNLQETEILTSEALALAKLSVDKVKAGLIDMELDQAVPQLVGPSSGGMGSMNGRASTMPGMTKSQKRGASKTKSGDTMQTPNSDEDEPKGSSSGMGM